MIQPLRGTPARPGHAPLALAAVLALSAALAPGLAAQRTGGLDAPEGAGWRPSLGVRAGLDYRNQVPAVGAVLRLPVPGTPVSLSPGGDLVFHEGLTERQGTVDVTWGFGGLHLGGGPVALNSVFTGDAERETKVGYTFLIAVRGRMGQLGTDLELRWMWVDELDPRFISLVFTWTPGASALRGGL